MQVSKLIIVVCILLTACSTVKTTNKEKETQKRVANINMQLGMAYLEEKNMQRAKEKFLYALNEAPNLPEVQYSMGYFYESIGEAEQAKGYYLKAVALAPNRGDTQNNYGTFLCRNHNYQEAIEHFNLAVQDPNYLNTAEANENAGICAAKIPDNQLALTYFKKAILQDNNRSTAYYHLAELYYKMGQYKSAQEALDKYHTIADSSPESESFQEKLARKLYA